MTIDPDGLAAFIQRFAADVGTALQASTIVIGDKLGLYAALADLGPAEADELAATTGCDSRLVQDWLDAQVVSGYCRFSVQTGRYWLPPEQAAVLADRSNPAFMVGGSAPAWSGAGDAGHRSTTPTSRAREQQESKMSGIEINDFSSPDEVRRPDPTVNVEVVKMAAGEIGRYTFQPGWRWSEHIKPVVGGTACQTEHVGYLVSGTMGIQTADGTTAEITSGSVYHIDPGHDGWVVGDQPVVVVEFQGARNYAKSPA